MSGNSHKINKIFQTICNPISHDGLVNFLRKNLQIILSQQISANVLIRSIKKILQKVFQAFRKI